MTRLSHAVAIALLSVGGISGCGGESNKVTPPVVPATKTRVLRIDLSSGVASTLVAGETSYPDGAIVSYTVGARPGFQNPRVVLDGLVVTRSGQIVMDRARSLIATADSLAPLPRADSLLANSLSQAAVKADPVALSQMLDRVADSLVNNVGDDAARAFDAIASRAFVPERDAAVLVAALHVGPALVQSQRSESGGSHVAGINTEIIYVNGIRTDQAQWRLTWQGALAPLARRNGLTTANGVNVGGFYNRTAWVQSASAQQFLMCVTLKWKQIANGIQSALMSLPGCLPIGGITTDGGVAIGDFAEAFAQVVNLTLAKGDPALVQIDAVLLANTILAHRLQGKRIVLVTHSQGNLMMAEAIKYLGALAQWRTSDFACLGWVSIAPPLVPVAAASMRAPSSLIIKGTNWEDVLQFTLSLQPGDGAVLRVKNELSDTYDGQGWFWAQIFKTNPAYQFGVKGALHEIVSSYLGMPATADRIGAAMKLQVSQLNESCNSVGPAIGLSSGAITFSATAGTSSPPNQSVAIVNSGGGTLNALTLGTVNYGNGQPTGWLTSRTLSGTTAPATIALGVSTTGLAPGTYTATFTVAASGATNTPQIVTVTFVVSPTVSAQAIVTIVATDAAASEVGPDGGTFTVGRTGATTAALPVNFTLTGTATNGTDYATVSGPVTIPAGQLSATVQIAPIPDGLIEGTETVILTLAAGNYTIGTPSSGTVTIADAGSSSSGTLVSGETRNGTISTAGQTSTLTFAATQGDAIVLSAGQVESPATMYPWLRVVSPSGAIVGEDRRYAAAQVTISAPATGTYTVIVGSNDGFGGLNGTGNYRLTLVRAPGTLSISPGDDGGVMTNGASHFGALSVGDIDPWTVSATQGDAIVLSVGQVESPATMYPWIRVVSPTGAIIAEDRRYAAAQITISAPTTGAYTVIVGTNDGFGTLSNTGSYILSLVKAPGTLSISPGDEGGPMTNGSTHTGLITKGDVDPWTFSATQGDAIVLSVGQVQTPATMYPWIRLVSPTGAIVGEDRRYAAAQISVSAAVTGTYTVIIGSNDGFGTLSNTGTYTLSLVKAPGTIAVSPADEGGPMINGVGHVGTLTKGDIDPWTFSAAQGETIALSVGQVETPPTMYPWIRLVSPAGVIVAEDRRYAATQVTVTAPTSGVYTVIVGSNDGFGTYSNTGGYVLTLVKVPGSVTISPGDEGGPMASGSNAGNLSVGDLDPWTFSATQGSSIVLTLAKGIASSSMYPWIRLVSPAGVILREDRSFSGAQISITAPATGTFTVLVSSNDGFGTYSGAGSYVLTRAGASQDLDQSSMAHLEGLTGPWAHRTRQPKLR